jgi:ribosomal protein L25 (general stress protein Ctc)
MSPSNLIQSNKTANLNTLGFNRNIINNIYSRRLSNDKKHREEKEFIKTIVKNNHVMKAKYGDQKYSEDGTKK